MTTHDLILKEGKWESPFSPILSTLQIAWDQTSMSAFQTCPRYYEYTIIHGYVPKMEPIYFFFGRFFHSALEVFDTAIFYGKSRDDAADEALAHVLEGTHGWVTTSPIHNRDNLIRAIIWYIDKWQDATDQVIELNGKPAVELSFRFQPGFSSVLTGEPFLMTGHMDVVVKFEGEIMPKERKTTKSQLDMNYYSTFSPGLQFSWYSLGSQVILMEPARKILLDAAQLGAGFTEFGRHIVERRPQSHNEFLRDLESEFRQVENCAEANYWPKRERNCWICPFKNVCSAPPDLRFNALEADFSKRTWNPLESR